MMDGFLIALVYEDDEEHVERLRERRRLWRLRDSSNPFLLEDAKFIKLFRLPKHGVMALIENFSNDHRLTKGAIPPHIKILCALNFYGQGCYQSSVGQTNCLGLSQATVSLCLRLVSNLIVHHLLPVHIKFPGTPQEKATAKQGFQQLGFPDVLGAVDGTHIGIVAPPHTYPTAPKRLFFNRKGYYSINAQVTCNSRGEILHVNPNFPGSTHDSAVWSASNLNRLLKEEYVGGARNQWLIGDKGYALVPWVMTPYTNVAAGTPAANYNKAHAKARIVVELCFGKLKNRFRCLLKHRILHYSPERAATIILACCTLHNMFIEHWTDDFDLPNYDQNDDHAAEIQPQEVDETDFFNEGQAVRRQITEMYFSNV